jgi:hypothetical protein
MQRITRNQFGGHGSALLAVLLFAVVFTFTTACDTGSGGGGDNNGDNDPGSIVGTWQKPTYDDEDGEFLFILYVNFKGSAASGPFDYWWTGHNNKEGATYTYTAPNITFVIDVNGYHSSGRAVLSNNNDTLTISEFYDPGSSDTHIWNGTWTRVN